MLNGTTGAAAVCCQYGSEQTGSYGTNAGTGAPVSLSALINNAPGARRGLLDTIKTAIDNAVHGGNSGFANGGGSGRALTGAGAGGSGNKVIPFPMVNPFKPVVKTGVPVPGLTADPRHVYYVGPDGSGVPDDEQFAGLSGLGSLGFTWADLNPGYPEYSVQPTKLQTILGAIETTLPATIQAFRASPQNIYPYNPYSTTGSVYPQQQYQQGAGADIGATAGAAAGNVADSFGSIVQRHPYLVLGAGAALLLLFMNPPRRGR